MGTIYKITNTVNGKCYIGKTTTDVKSRIYAHFNGTGSRLIKDAIEEYGLECFQWQTIYTDVPNECLNAYEIKAIETYDTFVPSGYNLTLGGDGVNTPNHFTQRRNAGVDKSKQPVVNSKPKRYNVYFNQDKFRNYCRHLPKAELQKATGLSRQTLYNRLKRLETLTLFDFLAICDALGEQPETFIEK